MVELNTLLLHRLRYGELSTDEEKAVRAAIAADPVWSERLRQQEAFRHQFELTPVPGAIREAARTRSFFEQAQDWLASWRGGAVVGGLAAMALALFVITGPFAEQPEYIGYKSGGIEVLVEGQGQLEPGEFVHPGDRIQVRTPPGPWAHAWVGDGTEMVADFELEPGRAVLAPFSLEIDSAPGDELLVLVVSESYIDRATAEKAADGHRFDGVKVYVQILPKR
jgi:hypothetical protein